jgi:hypothetical protein
MQRRSLLLLGFVGHLLACASHPATTQTTSAEQYAAGSTDLRTVDNAGYVDPGGRTTQVSTGGTTVTGRGVVNTPPARREYPSESAESTTTAGTGGPSAPADPIELRDRASRALCDRESYCDRVGPGKPFESPAACISAKRERVRAVMDQAACGEIRGDRVAQCLTAIRGAACGPSEEAIPPPKECTADVLCR